MHRSSSRTQQLLLAAVFVFLAWAGANLHAQDGYLSTPVNPGRAGVFVDGKYVGPARDFGLTRTYPPSPGEHQVVLREPRYKEYATTVKIEPGKRTKLSIGLEPLALASPPFGRLRTQGKTRFSAVFVNGRSMGHVDEFSNVAQGLLLPPGEYDLLIQSTEGQEHKEKIKIEVDKTTRVSVPF